MKELWVYPLDHRSDLLTSMMEERTMSCPPGIAFLQAGSEGGSRGEETASESRSSRAEVESEKANSKTSLSSRKENAGKSQPVDLTQVANLNSTQLFRLLGPLHPPSLAIKGIFNPAHHFRHCCLPALSKYCLLQSNCKSINIISTSKWCSF